MSAPDDVKIPELPELPDDLRALVSGMQGDPLEEDRVARVRQRLGPVLPPGGGGGGGGAGPARSGTRLGTKIGMKLAGLGVVALVGLGAYLGTRTTAAPVATPAPAVAPSEPAAPSAPAVASAAVSADPEPVASVEPPAPPVVSSTRPAASAHAPAESQDVVAEEDILHRARAALATSPQTALDLTNQHAKKFPHGVLGQEREIVAIEALENLGRSPEAASRAARFRTHFPASPYVQTLKNRGLVE